MFLHNFGDRRSLEIVPGQGGEAAAEFLFAISVSTGTNRRRDCGTPASGPSGLSALTFSTKTCIILIKMYTSHQTVLSLIAGQRGKYA